MNFFFKIIYVSALVIGLGTMAAQAQFTYNLSKYEVGMQIGGLVSRTALSPYSPIGAYKQIHLPSIQLFAQGPLFKPLLLRTGLMVGQIGSDDSKVTDPRYSAFLKMRQFKYTTTMAELSAVAVLNFFKEDYNLFSHEHKHKFSPYIFAGIGFSYVNIKRDWSGIDTAYFANVPTLLGLALDTMPTTLPKIVTVFPMGGGLRYAMTPQLALFGEFNFRYNFEHYLDGFNFSTGRSNSKDFFYGVSIGFSYRPPANDYRNNCPKSVL